MKIASVIRQIRAKISQTHKDFSYVVENANKPVQNVYPGKITTFVMGDSTREFGDVYARLPRILRLLATAVSKYKVDNH